MCTSCSRLRTTLVEEPAAGSISSWSQFRAAFIENFKSTYKRPASLEDLRACKQGTRETLRAYIQRWTILKNQQRTYHTKARPTRSGVTAPRRGPAHNK